MCWSRYRLVHGSSFTLLGSLFMCGKRAARKAFWDVAMFQLMCDPLGRVILIWKYSCLIKGHMLQICFSIHMVSKKKDF